MKPNIFNRALSNLSLAKLALVSALCLTAASPQRALVAAAERQHHDTFWWTG